MTFEIIDDFLEKEDLDYIINTFFPKDPNNANNFAWNFVKGIVRDPELGPTGYEKDDWMYNKPLFTSENNQLKFDAHLIRLDCSTSWVENKIIDTVKLLRSDIFPKPSLNCEYCNYLKKRWLLSLT